MAYKIKSNKTFRVKPYQFENKSYDLGTHFDSADSFYGKARVRQENGKKILTSYNTDVAKIENGKASINGTYSQTTLRHIKEFLLQNGFKAESKKQIEKDYLNKNIV